MLQYLKGKDPREHVETMVLATTFWDDPKNYRDTANDIRGKDHDKMLVLKNMHRYNNVCKRSRDVRGDILQSSLVVMSMKTIRNHSRQTKTLKVDLRMPVLGEKL